MAGIRGAKRENQKLPNDQNRLSRHYYDVAKVWSAKSEDIINNLELFDDVVNHNVISGFNRAWMKTKGLTIDTLDICPHADLISVLRKDYAQMQEMIFNEAEDFDVIIEAISSISEALKDISSSPSMQKSAT